MSFWDRISQYPGRVKLTDVDTGDEQIVDVVRYEGTVTDEGTFLNSAGFDEALASYFDIGQMNSDLIAEELSSTGVTIASDVTGAVKYGQYGRLRIVHCKLVAGNAISGNSTIASGIPADYRPSADIAEGTRASDRVKVKLGTDGRISVDGDYAIGTQFFCDFAFYV